MAGGASSCGDDSVDNQTGADAGTTGGVTTGTYNHYATNSIKFGANATEAATYGFDLDGKNGADNQIGKVLAPFGAQLMLQTQIDSAVTNGTFVILHSVRADDLTSDGTVSWQIYLGNPQASPKFDGTGTFSIKSNSPTDAKVTGAIAGGKFTASPGKLTIEIQLSEGTSPLRVNLQAARIEATITSAMCSGKIGGAIKQSDLTNDVIPFLADQFDARIASDAGCRENLADCDTSSMALLTLFDPDHDRHITIAEVTANTIVQGITAPDVDVLKADGTAGTDGVVDSTSIGLGFSCVKGSFTASGEQ